MALDEVETVLKFEPADRRRILMATAVTVIALPSLWLLSRNDPTGAPNVATLGVDVGGAAEAATTTEARPDPMGAPGAAYLDGPTAGRGTGPIEIAIAGEPAGERRQGRASFRSTVPAASICTSNALPSGVTVTVTNLDNGRSVACRVQLAPSSTGDLVTLHPDAFLQIAVPTDAPAHVEISW